MNNRRIAVMGSVNMDLMLRCSHLPQAGETVLGRDFAQHPGGKGANQAVAAARMGGDVRFIGCVGDDAFGREARAGLQAAGVDLVHLHTVPATATGIAMVTIDDQGENCIALAPGANQALSIAHIDQAEAEIAASAMLVCQFEVPLETVMRAKQLAYRHHVPFLLNPAPAQALPLAAFAGTAILVANSVEAAMLSGMPVASVGQAIEASEFLRSNGIASVVITLGKDGVVLASQTGVAHFPAFKVDAVDTTGAGDTFVGALSVALVSEMAMGEAVQLAQRAAAFSVTRRGGQASMPNAGELAAFFAGRAA